MMRFLGSLQSDRKSEAGRLDCNTQRLHSSLGYRSPAEYVQRAISKQIKTLTILMDLTRALVQ